MSPRLLHERRCDCIACCTYRIAIGLFLTGLGVLVLLAALITPPEHRQLLIDNVTADGSAK